MNKMFYENLDRLVSREQSLKNAKTTRVFGVEKSAYCKLGHTLLVVVRPKSKLIFRY